LDIEFTSALLQCTGVRRPDLTQAREESMEPVNQQDVQARYVSGLPRTLELRCPHCRERARFHSRPWQEHGIRVAAAEAPCELCEKTVQLVQMVDANAKAIEGALWVTPPPGERRAMRGVEHLEAMSQPLAREYASVLRLFNCAHFGAAALTLRHMVEGLVPMLLPKDRQDVPQHRQLEALANLPGCARPLQRTAQLLGPDGPFERAFSDVAAIDRDKAEQMLDVVENLVTCLVIQPAMLEALNDRIGGAREDNAPVQLPVRRVAMQAAAAG
jgi:hypothetical protein